MKVSAKKKRTVTGLSLEAELGLSNAMSNAEGREFVAEMLRSMHFMNSVSGDGEAYAQENAVIWGQLIARLNKHDWLLMISEHFSEDGGADNERRNDDDRDNDLDE